MKARVLQVAVSLAWFACVGSTLHASDAPAPATTSTPAPNMADIDKALINGDAARVREVGAAMKLGPGNMHLMETQLAYDLRGLLPTALQCRDAELAMNVVPGAIACNVIAFHTALHLGNAREAFGALAWFKKVGFPYQARATGKPASFGNAMDRVDLQHLADTLPEFSTTLAPGAATLKYVNLSTITSMDAHGQMKLEDAGVKALPAISVEVNGKKVDAFVDTGMGDTLVMDQVHADALGVKPLVTGLPPAGTIAMGPLGTSLTFGIADKLVVGPLTFHNVVILVAPGSALLADRVILGLPAVARFRQVSFGKDAITVGGDPVTCKAPLPLVFASTVNEDGKLVFDAKADGKVIKASIDTGSTAALLAGHRLALPGMEKQTLDSAPTRYLKLAIGDNTIIDNLSTPVITTMEVPDVMVGAPLIAGWDMRFNFDKPWLCLEGRKPAATLP